MSNHWRPGEIVVELGGRSNNYYLVKMLGATLRGKWSARHIPNPSSRATGMSAMPDIPGIMLALDQNKKTLRAVDPLGFSEYAKTLAEANRVAKKYFGDQRPCDEVSKKNLTDSEIKTALWDMAEMIRAGTATVVSGVIPAADKIMAMPGRLIVRLGVLSQKDNPEATEEEERRILATVG